MSTRVLPDFALLNPRTFAEAIALAKKHGENARILAGGTDILVKMKSGDMTPTILIGISKIDGLDAISYDEDAGLSIGALSTIRAIETSATRCRKCLCQCSAT